MKRLVRWKGIREFLLYGFSDAASIESGKERPESVYDQVQIRIMHALDDALFALGAKLDKPVVVVAQSLGCQVISNYLWDSQRRSPQCKKPRFGVWRDGTTKGEEEDSCKDRFRRLQSLRVLFTTGCNIPIFVAGHSQVTAIFRPNPKFEWMNYYDKDDVLGWPLQPLSNAYRGLVQDVRISAGGSLWSRPIRSRTPLCHGAYWSDPAFLQPVVACLKSLLPQESRDRR